MEDIAPESKIVRMEQVFAVGGTYNEPAEFTRAINKNLIILQDSDKNCEVKDIKFNVFTDQRYTNSSPVYLAFIIAEVDVDLTPEPDTKKKKTKKRKKKK
ncbi:MAG: hypothetical protein KGD73_05935 [Candidatus Lokiarchaeota archaeon]|nr:hypothetical protein [Candidatus Lokiarchaeota archaeon]